MTIQENVSLQNMTTMKVGGRARFFVSATSEADIEEAVQFAQKRSLPIFVLGGGSNIVISDDGFDGLVVKNCIEGVSFDEEGELIYATVGAGEVWDDFVEEAVSRNLYGVENLSFIPGTVGAAPVQNIGAYGAEVKDTIVSVRAFNINLGVFEEFSKEACGFAYRNSIFKRKQHHIITSVTLGLQKSGVLNLSYADLQRRVDEVGLTRQGLTVADVRDMVIAIRKHKLPDWRVTPTAGSFFKNPEISKERYLKLKDKFPDVPGFELAGGSVKVSLAWLIEHACHLKGAREGGAGIFKKHALVIVNERDASALDVKSLSERVRDCVVKTTGITAEAEVQFIGNF